MYAEPTLLPAHHANIDEQANIDASISYKAKKKLLEKRKQDC